VERNGALTEVARGENNGPWTGIAFANGSFYVAEGGQMKGGRILRITPDGRLSALIENLPSFGDHHTNGPAIGRDGQIYFTVGVATNAGVVGEDNFKFGWLKRFPQFHDVPCRDIELSGQNFESPNVLVGQWHGADRCVRAVRHDDHQGTSDSRADTVQRLGASHFAFWRQARADCLGAAQSVRHRFCA